MAVTDEQLGMLEAYIDGELPADQEDGLRKQLEADSELAGALEMVRGERTRRENFWRACEPDELTVQRLVMRVEAAVNRHAIWAYRLARWRIPSAAAACILIGFMVGWIGRGTSPVTGGEPGQPMMVANNPANPITNVVNVPSPANPANIGVPGLTTVNASRPVDLPLVDEYGRVVAVQHFKSAEEAAKFIEDCNNFQRAQEKVKSGNVTPVGAQKF